MFSNYYGCLSVYKFLYCLKQDKMTISCRFSLELSTVKLYLRAGGAAPNNTLNELPNFSGDIIPHQADIHAWPYLYTVKIPAFNADEELLM